MLESVTNNTSNLFIPIIQTWSSSYLCGLGVTSFLHLKLLLLGETNTEHPKKVTISGLDINMSLDHGLPFLDHRAEFVTGQIHAVEVGQNIASLNFFSHQFELPEGYFIILKISQGDLKHSPLQAIRSNPCKTQINKFKIVSFYLPKYIDGMLCAFLNTEKG